MSGAVLRGITWDHRRALDPLVSTMPGFRARRPSVDISWTARPLHALEDIRDAPCPTLSPPGTLTAQEKRVAALVATGATNADIARQLYLSVNTVETHLDRIYAKLGIHTRYQLIAMALNRQPEP